MLKSVSSSVLLLAVATAVAGAQAATNAYTTGVHRYRITREGRSSQEVMGQTQTGTTTTVEEFTLDLRPGGRDTLRFTYTIDSASQQANPPAAEPPMLKGRKISGQISARGLVHQFDKDTSGAEDISAGYRNFLPQIPATGLKVGATWADTLRTPFTQGGINGTTQSIIVSRVTGDTTIADQRAWRLERTGTLTMSGTGSQQGTDLVLAGSGSATGASWISTTGVYLGASSTQTLELTVQVPMANLTIPIKQTTVTKIERLPAPASR